MATLVAKHLLRKKAKPGKKAKLLNKHKI